MFELRWFKTFIWTLATFFAILFVLPLAYELFVIATPEMDASAERNSRQLVQFTSNIFSWVALFLGCLVAWNQRQTHIRRERLHKRVIERTREKRRQAREAQYEKLYGKKPPKGRSAS
ncbi:hypothetical protein CWE12_10775 [Aliidiomarina sedimenti]|uniref:Uncharacterized protein n=1 Tax=Aliidiomarina sedimenti TaxID=1933879 RepID=A0ABY0BWL3_9GAMM|nr:hypothetical protein [Aliidiomarina sedimenti]RUO28788.1 hypothetical protein CWE12_10775 [Aliidiomarina sedimenti]